MNKSQSLAPIQFHDDTIYTLEHNGQPNTPLRPTQAQKLELLKEQLGWYFGGVAPKAWNPYENVSHMQYLLTSVDKEKKVEAFFADAVNESVFETTMLPFKNPGRVIDLCGEFWKLWEPAPKMTA